MQKNFRAIRLYEEDYEEVEELKRECKIPLCQLMHLAIPVLKDLAKKQINNEEEKK